MTTRTLLVLTAAACLALAFGIPLGLERFNDTASKLEELEQELNLKGLGIVPVTPAGDLEDIVRSPEVDARIPNSLLENFRVIRAGITMNGDSDQDSQVIMITSARPSERNIGNPSKSGQCVTRSRPVPSVLMIQRSKLGMPGFPFEPRFEQKMIRSPSGWKNGPKFAAPLSVTCFTFVPSASITKISSRMGDTRPSSRSFTYAASSSGVSGRFARHTIFFPSNEKNGPPS